MTKLKIKSAPLALVHHVKRVVDGSKRVLVRNIYIPQTV